MTMFRPVAWVFFCLFLLAGEAFALDEAVQWQPLEPGLDLARVTVSFTPPARLPSQAPGQVQTPGQVTGDSPGSPPQQPADQSSTMASGQAPVAAPATGAPAEPMAAATTILRIDPARYAFSLYMASESGLKTLADVCKSEGFTAAINAGMFQRDGLTNTGYLRSRTHSNNAHVAANFGAFFVAEPDNGKPPLARLLDRQTDDWETAIKQHGIVLQNYRMATSGGRVLWKQSERYHSVAALSQDASGRVLFLLCPSPVPAAEYMTALLNLPLGIGTVMYLEGGSEAALFVNAGGVNAVEAGRHSSGLWGGSASLMLPNVLGIRKRAAPPAP
ncbi:exported hypothetical protein [uncultured delta proteobacterium]|uniref:Phosphodiester glycosidase domain-containing protein n=1 Tax=uncultured delta proteobacterium TaxID=34034 RepID=A0A212K0S2_9DELT|nr:exported hypothetical protein [uncultured delta proteobacterium]